MARDRGGGRVVIGRVGTGEECLAHGTQVVRRACQRESCSSFLPPDVCCLLLLLVLRRFQSWWAEAKDEPADADDETGIGRQELRIGGDSEEMRFSRISAISTAAQK